MGWSDSFDLLWNCILLQMWVCMCTRVPICGAVEWIWWGSTSQCPERVGFQYRGQFGKHMYPLAKSLVAFGFVCYLGTLETIFLDPSVHSAHDVSYLPLSGLVAPETLYFRSPSAFWCGGVVRVCPLQRPAMCRQHRQYRHTYSNYIKVLGQCLGLHNNVTSVVFSFGKL